MTVLPQRVAHSHGNTRDGGNARTQTCRSLLCGADAGSASGPKPPWRPQSRSGGKGRSGPDEDSLSPPPPPALRHRPKQGHVRRPAKVGQTQGTVASQERDKAAKVPQGCGEPQFFLVKHSPQGPPTANRQPPTAANRQPPTANRCQPPTANRQPLPTANRQPLPTASRQPPTATNH